MCSHQVREPEDALLHITLNQCIFGAFTPVLTTIRTDVNKSYNRACVIVGQERFFEHNCPACLLQYIQHHKCLCGTMSAYLLIYHESFAAYFWFGTNLHITGEILNIRFKKVMVKLHSKIVKTFLLLAWPATPDLCIVGLVWRITGFIFFFFSEIVQQHLGNSANCIFTFLFSYSI